MLITSENTHCLLEFSIISKSQLLCDQDQDINNMRVQVGGAIQRHSLASLRIQRAEDDGVDGVMSSEEQPAGGDTSCQSLRLLASHRSGDEFPPSSIYFLWLSVSVMPCADTLKWTTVDGGGGAEEMVCVVAF